MWSQTGCQRSVLLQRAAPAKAATIAFPPRSLVRCAAHSHNLQPWQQAKLEEAYVQGKRKVKVNDLSKEIGLDRQVVLQWFKDQEALPESVRSSLHDARMAALQADQERANMLSLAAAQRAESPAGPSSLGEEALLPPAERQRKYYARKRLAWDVEATLVKVYEAHRGHPSDDMVNSLAELHRIPRKRIVEWFKQRRTAEHTKRQQQRAARGKDGQGSRRTGGTGVGEEGVRQGSIE